MRCFLILFLAVSLPALAQAPKTPDLKGYRTVDKAQTTKIALGGANASGQTGYLGVAVTRDAPGKGFKGKKGEPPLTLWTKPVFRVAVVPIDYADVKHKSSADDWRENLFGKGNKLGSLSDWFREQSAGAFALQGVVLDPVELKK